MVVVLHEEGHGQGQGLKDVPHLHTHLSKEIGKHKTHVSLKSENSFSMTLLCFLR